MAKWRKWLFLSACVFALGVMAAFLTSKPEPTYQGRPLSSWLEIYGTELDNRPEDQKGGDAIRQIGTNALPLLLKWTSYEPPPAKIRPAIISVLIRIPAAMLPDAMEYRLDPAYKESRAYTAAMSFMLFRDHAQLVIPPLSQLMNDTKSPVASRNAVVALAYVGNDAIPVLSAQLANPKAPNRGLVALMCGVRPALATNTDSILPQLIRCLDDQDSKVRNQAVQSLAKISYRYQLQPALVIPALTNCLRAGSPIPFRNSAILGLGNYGVQARAAVPLLLQMTADPEAVIRTLATNALLKIAPETITNSASLH